MKFFRQPFFILFFVYFLLLGLYSLFSYSLTAPNLVLSSLPAYWQFQLYMWETFFNNRHLLSYSYLVLIFLLFLIYFLFLFFLKKSELKFKNPKNFFICYLLIISPLLFSNNALSYDVFNYMFNAKEVLLYHANPHIQIPLDFPQDDWLRFMHNTHTSAPYGYAWTALSLIPYSLGLGKFLPTWILFRLFSLLSLILLFYALKFFAKKINLKLSTYALAILFFNPFFLLEVLSNAHNDLWMLVPVLFSLGLLIGKKLKLKNIIFSLVLLIFSINIKLATLLLLPVWLFLIIENFKNIKIFKFFEKNIILVSSIALFLPLLTERSKQFLPWYLLWSFVWLPLLVNKKLKFWPILLLVFSLTAMLRYLPFLWFGSYEIPVPVWEKYLLWSAVPFSLLLTVVLKLLAKYKKFLLN